MPLFHQYQFQLELPELDPLELPVLEELELLELEVLEVLLEPDELVPLVPDVLVPLVPDVLVPLVPDVLVPLVPDVLEVLELGSFELLGADGDGTDGDGTDAAGVDEFVDPPAPCGANDEPAAIAEGIESLAPIATPAGAMFGVRAPKLGNVMLTSVASPGWG